MKPFALTTMLAALLALTACRSSPDAWRTPHTNANSTMAATTTAAAEREELRAVAVDEEVARVTQASAISEEDSTALQLPLTEINATRRGEMIEIDGARAYLSLPRDVQAPVPGIVVVHEWWGLNANVVYWTDRLAAEGYAALAVDLYGGVVATDTDTASAAMNAVDPARALKTMLDAVEFLKTDPRIRAPRTASIGWSFGGTQSLELALASPSLDAAVVYYGNPVLDATRLTHLHADLLGVYGTRDRNIPTDKVLAFEKALAIAGKPSMIRFFDAEHAFANPSTARYDEKATADAWTLVRGFLKSKLSAPRS